jgi:DNA-binding XRE family transcriptional regulator
MGSRLKISPKRDVRGVTCLEIFRIRSGHSMSSLARASGISRKVLWQIELQRDAYHPRPDTAAKIVEALNAKLDTRRRGGCKFEDIFDIV